MKYPDSSIKNLVSTTSDPDGTNDPNIDPNDPDCGPNDDTDTVPDGVIIPETIQIPTIQKKYAFLGNRPMMFRGKIVTINDTDRNIYELIKYNPKISCSQIASILKVSRKTVSRYIVSLRERRLIQFDGYPRSGKWIVIKEYSKESDKT